MIPFDSNAFGKAIEEAREEERQRILDLPFMQYSKKRPEFENDPCLHSYLQWQDNLRREIRDALQSKKVSSMR